MSRQDDNFVHAERISHFRCAAKDTRKCTRCRAKLNEKSLYSIIAQVSEHRLSGGMLCARCVSSFRQWMMEKSDEGK